MEVEIDHLDTEVQPVRAEPASYTEPNISCHALEVHGMGLHGLQRRGCTSDRFTSAVLLTPWPEAQLSLA